MLRIGEVARKAHCRRVAGWATQFARNLDYSSEELQALEADGIIGTRPPGL